MASGDASWYSTSGLCWALGLAACLHALRLFLRWRKKTFSYFKEIGIPGPEPNLLWGNLWEYHRKGITNAVGEWSEKYGDIYGFYNGDVPTLVVNDLDFLSYVMIKNFPNFTNRGITMRTDEEHERLGKSLLHNRDLQWKRNRSCVSYAFTASKFKKLFPHLGESADILLEEIAKEASTGKETSVCDLYKPLAMDYISGASFGIETSFQKDRNHPLFLMAKKVLPGIMTGPFHMIAQSTTTMKSVVSPLLWLNCKLGSFTYDKFSKLAYKAMERRWQKPSETSKADILQVMLDAETTEDFQETEIRNGDVKVPKKLTHDEVLVNAGALLIAGVGTTSSALSFVTFNLAKFPDIQKKVRDEVREAIRKNGSVDYTAVTQNMKYLANVVDETLRLYPVVVTFTTRSSLNAFEYGGVKYKAGLSIMAPTILVHKDPRYWSEPDKFDPDRFLPENVALQHSMAYQPFGMGPRNCVGKRLSLIEVIYTIARIVDQFELELGESQKDPMKMKFFGMGCEPSEGPFIKFRKI